MIVSAAMNDKADATKPGPEMVGICNVPLFFMKVT